MLSKKKLQESEHSKRSRRSSESHRVEFAACSFCHKLFPEEFKGLPISNLVGLVSVRRAVSLSLGSSPGRRRAGPPPRRRRRGQKALQQRRHCQTCQLLLGTFTRLEHGCLITKASMDRIQHILERIDELTIELSKLPYLNNTEAACLQEDVTDARLALHRLSRTYFSCLRRRELLHMHQVLRTEADTLADSGWFSLFPDEILLLVLQHCIQADFKAIALLSRVCKRLRKLCRDDQLWRMVYCSLWCGWLASPLRDSAAWRDCALRLLRTESNFPETLPAVNFRHASFGDPVTALALQHASDSDLVWSASASGRVRAKRLRDMTLAYDYTQDACTASCYLSTAGLLCVGDASGAVHAYGSDGVRSAMSPHATEITALADGSRLASGSAVVLSAAVDRTVSLCGLAGELTSLSLEAAERWVCALTCDTERAYGVGGEFCTVWDSVAGARTRSTKMSEFTLSRVAVRSSSLYVGSTSGSVLRFDVRSPGVERLASGSDELVEMQIAESLLFVTCQQSVSVYDTRQLKPQPLRTIRPLLTDFYTCAQFDYAWLLLGHATGTVSVYDIRKEDAEPYSVKLSQPNVRALASGANRLAAADNAGFVRVWTLPDL